MFCTSKCYISLYTCTMYMYTFCNFFTLCRQSFDLFKFHIKYREFMRIDCKLKLSIKSLWYFWINSFGICLVHSSVCAIFLLWRINWSFYMYIIQRSFITWWCIWMFYSGVFMTNWLSIIIFSFTIKSCFMSLYIIATQFTLYTYSHGHAYCVYATKGHPLNPYCC